MTLRELTLAIRALTGGRIQPPGKAELDRLMARFPDEREIER